ncbi:hypothetical protein FRC01_002148 [Tulasnella sp. 417]|nr:hypothetical protein FRC01_002148 [Tulasnella sp. 417]
MNPISITTGAGPLGATIIHPQPPSPGAYTPGGVWSDGLDPAQPTFNSGDPFSSQHSATHATAPQSSLSSPASQLVTTQPTPNASQATTKLKKAYKPQPPKVSSLSETVIKKAAKRKSEKKGLEDVLVQIHKSNASTVARQLKEETRLKHNDQILAQFSAGLLTREEC